jgi:glycine/D-amino acid oxidase-like deaminating enzyme
MRHIPAAQEKTDYSQRAHREVEMSDKYDLIVIGGGSIGLSTAYHASRRNLRTLVVERFGYFNNIGSSAGASRQYRVQYSEKYLAELALAAQNYWADLQLRTFDQLIGVVGSVWFGDPSLASQEGGIGEAMKTMNKLGIPYTPLNAGQIETLFRFKDLPANYTGFFQPNGGIINLKATQAALYNVARNSGQVVFHEYETVTNIEPVENDSIVVTTEDAQGEHVYKTDKLAITPGPYVNEILVHLSLSINLDIWEMSSAYYRKREPGINFPTWFVFQKPQTTSLFYGFPEVEWDNPGYIRVAPDIPDRILSDPSQRSGAPSPKSLALNSEWVRNHMDGLDDEPQFTSTCLIALSNDSKELLLDYPPERIPSYQNIVIYTAGWAAKFIPILGEMVLQLLEKDRQYFEFGKYKIDRSHFKIQWPK